MNAQMICGVPSRRDANCPEAGVVPPRLAGYSELARQDLRAELTTLDCYGPGGLGCALVDGLCALAGSIKARGARHWRLGRRLTERSGTGERPVPLQGSPLDVSAGNGIRAGLTVGASGGSASAFHF
jgi:hypothetical protein